MSVEVDPRAFYFEGDDIGYPEILVCTRQSEHAVNVLTRVTVRYSFVDRRGRYYNWPERDRDPRDFPSWIGPVMTYGNDCYMLYFDAYILPPHRITLLRILLEEIEKGKLVVDRITVPYDRTIPVVVGPNNREVLGDVEYSGWRPLDLLRELEVPGFTDTDTDTDTVDTSQG